MMPETQEQLHMVPLLAVGCRLSLGSARSTFGSFGHFGVGHLGNFEQVGNLLLLIDEFTSEIILQLV